VATPKIPKYARKQMGHLGATARSTELTTIKVVRRRFGMASLSLLHSSMRVDLSGTGAGTIQAHS
jgi:hypothetical protein